MADLDAELLERAARWCAEAGRTVTPGTLRRALAGLAWDELLRVRALLADPPPARPLGAFALADLARGVPADVAAEREREGRYPSGVDDPGEAAPSPAGAVPTTKPAPAPAPATPTAGGKKKARRGRGPGVVIRRARDAAPAGSAEPAPAPSAPFVDELLLPGGRSVLERLVRRHGARRKALVAALAAWRTPSGAAPGDAELDRLLDHHDLARAFARREHDELLHALRAARGIRSEAATRLGLAPGELLAALERLGAAAEAERIRDERRAVLRRKATLSERARLLLSDAARLEDLGLLAEVEEDLRRRLPEHVRALRETGARLSFALSQSLSVTAAEAGELAARLGLAIAPAAPLKRERPRGGDAPRREWPRGGDAAKRERPRGGDAPKRERPGGGDAPKREWPRGGDASPRRRPTPSASGRASPSRTPPRPRTSRRSASSSSGRSGR